MVLYLSDNTNLKDIFRTQKWPVMRDQFIIIGHVASRKYYQHPVLMSLRERGKVHTLYPLMDRFNYFNC
jgi:hypothetical protein